MSNTSSLLRATLLLLAALNVVSPGARADSFVPIRGDSKAAVAFVGEPDLRTDTDYAIRTVSVADQMELRIYARRNPDHFAKRIVGGRRFYPGEITSSLTALRRAEPARWSTLPSEAKSEQAYAYDGTLAQLVTGMERHLSGSMPPHAALFQIPPPGTPAQCQDLWQILQVNPYSRTYKVWRDAALGTVGFAGGYVMTRQAVAEWRTLNTLTYASSWQNGMRAASLSERAEKLQQLAEQALKAARDSSNASLKTNDLARGAWGRTASLSTGEVFTPEAEMGIKILARAEANRTMMQAGWATHSAEQAVKASQNLQKATAAIGEAVAASEATATSLTTADAIVTAGARIVPRATGAGFGYAAGVAGVAMLASDLGFGVDMLRPLEDQYDANPEKILAPNLNSFNRRCEILTFTVKERGFRITDYLRLEKAKMQLIDNQLSAGIPVLGEWDSPAEKHLFSLPGSRPAGPQVERRTP